MPGRRTKLTTRSRSATAPRRSFRQHYDDLEARRAELCQRLSTLGHKAEEHPAAQQHLPQGKAGAATRSAAVGRLADRHSGKGFEHAIAGYLRSYCGGPYPLVNDCKSSGKCLDGQTRFFVMANTVFTADSPILLRGSITGRLTMLGIEFIGYGFLMLAFTAVQYACLLTSALKD